MILVTVGTQFFDELILEVDRLVESGFIIEPVKAQVGLSKVRAEYLDTFAFDPDLAELARQARLIITHAGTGSVCECLELGRPFIAVVNDTKADNHQAEFLEHMSTLYDFCWVHSPSDLAAALPQARPARPIEARSADRLASDISEFLLT